MRSTVRVSSFQMVGTAIATCLLAITVSVAGANAQISEGPNTPGSATNDASFGSTAWINPGNALSSNDVYAQGTPAGSPTQYLKVSNFGFSIPGPAQIVGIEARIERRSLGGMIVDSRVRIVKGGVVGSTERAAGGTWPTVDTVATYGSSSDLWGETWTPSDINANDFGLALSVFDSADLALVDVITLQVYYSLCADTPSGGCRTALKSIFTVKDKTPDTKDKLIWKWIKGQSTSAGDFEDPVDPFGGTNYALCIYAGSANAMIASTLVEPGLNWSNISTKGFKYLDPNAAQSGIQKIILKASLIDKAKALVKGKGDQLPTITPPLALPVTVQLVNSSTGVCWEGSYNNADLKKNEAGSFKAKAQ